MEEATRPLVLITVSVLLGFLCYLYYRLAAKLFGYLASSLQCMASYPPFMPPLQSACVLLLYDLCTLQVRPFSASGLRRDGSEGT